MEGWIATWIVGSWICVVRNDEGVGGGVDVVLGVLLHCNFSDLVRSLMKKKV